jgi:diaminopimelate decarboxylase
MTAMSPAVRRIGTESATSVYVYDLDRLRRRCGMVSGLRVDPKRVFFATMANDHPGVLGCVRDAGLGAFVNSAYHLDLVLKLGFPPDRIVYASSNMTPDELATCVRLGVHLVLDSLGQLAALCDVLDRRPGQQRSGPVEVGVRVNVGSALDRAEVRLDPTYRFGMLEQELPAAVALANRGGARIVGVHSYFGTDVIRPAVLLQGLRMLDRAAGQVPDLRYLDVGGGFGVPDDFDGREFDLEEYQRGAEQIMRARRRATGQPLELYIEPGRYLAADCGYYFVKVIDVKPRPDRVFVGSNGSIAEFPRPLLYTDRARHPCELLSTAGRGPVHELPIFVCGNTTYSQDFLARGIALPLPHPGDTLVLHHAGAYGRSMVTRFLGRRMPAEALVDASANRAADVVGRVGALAKPVGAVSAASATEALA